jgi:hypothetical protein
VTTTEFNILEQLDRDGPLTSTELHAGGLYAEARTWQGYVAKLLQLERRGFVRRSDPAAHIWAITDRGQEVVAL